MINIFDKQGNVRFSTPINIGAVGKFTLMEEDCIEIPFNTIAPIDFRVGDYVDMRGVLDESMGGKLSKIYQICKLTYPTYDNGSYKYNLRLDAYYYDWNRHIFKYTPEHGGKEASWGLTASLDTHLTIFIRNLNALGYNYNGEGYVFDIDGSVVNSAKALTYDHSYLLDSLFNMAKTWDCECWITDNVIHFGRCEFGDEVRISLGEEASNINRSESKGTYANRIYAFGSTKNLPTNYRPIDESLVVGGVVQRRLMLPEGIPYIDADDSVTQDNAIEAVLVLDDIYPRFDGNISDVSSYESTVENEDGTQTTQIFYQYKDEGFKFSKDYVLGGQELNVQFESGKLNGMTFGVMFNPKGLSENEADAQIWEIVANDDYGITLPNDVLFPSVGDKYVLTGWDSTKMADLGLVEKAEKLLEQETRKYVAKTAIDDGTYDTTLKSVWVHDDMINRSFDVGQRISLVHPAFMKEGRSSRVLGFEIKLDFPFDSPRYTIGESPKYSRLADIEGKIEQTTFKGQTYMGGISGGGSSVYLIKTNDLTAASNFNAFSALRSLAMFIRKDKQDTTEQILTFAKGLLVGSNGSGISVLGDGSTQAVVDRLYVKMKAVFDELQIKRKTQVGGEQILSHAGIKCTSVEEFEGYYRCYFLSELDGERIVNEFSVGSLAQSQSCNIEGKNRFYWREVVGVGANYIDLSKSSCAKDSDIPMSGDDIIAIGHTTDKDLQSVIVMSSVNENSPSIIFYAGIDDFSYTDKDIFSLGYDKSIGKAVLRLYGNAYIGSRDESTFVRYTEEKGVEIKGVVQFSKGSSGWQNIEGLPEEIKKASESSFENVQFGKYNLLVNSGFNGDYVTRQIDEDTEFNEEDDVFSTALDYWEHTNVLVQESDVSQSGREAVLSNGSLSQKLDLPTKIGESYIFSFKAKGTNVTISGGGYVEDIELTDTYQRYTRKFLCAEEAVDVSFSGDCTICELQLEIGTVPSSWGYNIKDNNSAIAYYQNLVYLASALRNGSTSVLGGLVLSSMIQLGNYSNGNLQDVTAVLSGIYNDGDDVLLTGGGNLEKAIYTVGLFRNDPSYQPTETELRKIANVVLTHGGRAILSDAIIRGTVYAKDGSFTGNVYAKDGVFKGTVYATDGEFKGKVYATDGEFIGTITSNDGTIGGWYISSTGISKNNVKLSSKGTISNGNYWKLNYDGSGSLAKGNITWKTDGTLSVKGEITATSGTFTGTVNAENGTFNGTITSGDGTIGGWVINEETISKNNVTLGADGSISNGNYWKLNNDGSGAIANGNISWNSDGNITFGESVTLAFGGVVDGKIGKKLTKIDANGIYTGTISADKITSGTISTATIRGKNSMWELNADGSGYFGLVDGEKGLSWDTSGNLKVKGNITADSGFVGDWAIKDGQLFKAGIEANENFTNTIGASGLSVSGAIGNIQANFGMMSQTIGYTSYLTAANIKGYEGNSASLCGIHLKLKKTDICIHSEGGSNSFEPQDGSFTKIKGLALGVRTAFNGTAPTNAEILSVSGSATLPSPSSASGKMYVVKIISGSLYVPNVFLWNEISSKNMTYSDNKARIFFSTGVNWIEISGGND